MWGLCDLPERVPESEHRHRMRVAGALDIRRRLFGDRDPIFHCNVRVKDNAPVSDGVPGVLPGFEGEDKVKLFVVHGGEFRVHTLAGFFGCSRVM